jgi:hypothetical protein
MSESDRSIHPAFCVSATSVTSTAQLNWGDRQTNRDRPHHNSARSSNNSDIHPLLPAHDWEQTKLEEAIARFEQLNKFPVTAKSPLT